VVRSTRRSTLGDRAFPVAAARAWNSLPPADRDAPSLLTFRSRLKTWLFELTLAWHWFHSPAALHFFFDFSNCKVPLQCYSWQCHSNLHIFNNNTNTNNNNNRLQWSMMRINCQKLVSFFFSWMFYCSRRQEPPLTFTCGTAPVYQCYVTTCIAPIVYCYWR